MPYLIFLKKQQNLKLSSAANYKLTFEASPNYAAEDISNFVPALRNHESLGISCALSACITI